MSTEIKIQNLVLIALSITMVFFLSSCVTTKQKLLDAGLKPSSYSELKVLFSKPVTADFFDSDSGQTFQIFYYPDGKVECKSSQFSDKGTYTFENNTMCSRWNKIRGGSKKCFSFFKMSETQYTVINPDGSKDGMLTITY